MLTMLYKVAPKHKHPWYRGVPGALLAAAVFIVASFGLRLYLSYVYAHGLTYGALATPITFLLFYYFVSMAIIIGAQFNNAMLEYYPPRRGRKSKDSQVPVQAGVPTSATLGESSARPDGTDPNTGGHRPSGPDQLRPATDAGALAGEDGSGSVAHAGAQTAPDRSIPEVQAGTLSGSSGPGNGLDRRRRQRLGGVRQQFARVVRDGFSRIDGRVEVRIGSWLHHECSKHDCRPRR